MWGLWLEAERTGVDGAEQWHRLAGLQVDEAPGNLGASWGVEWGWRPGQDLKEKTF